MKKVSVIVPTYNCAAYLPDCLDSLIGQSVHNFEVIIIDDASTDNTLEIISRYKKYFNNRLKYHKLEKRVGRGGVRNYGLGLAEGEYITFLDADDAYCPDKIEMQSKYLDRHSNVGGVACRFYFTNSFLQEPKYNAELNSAFKILFGKGYSNFEEGTPALMVRREILDRAGHFDEKILRGQDTDIMIRIIRISRVDTINVPLYFYRQHENNAQSLKGIRERTKSNVILHKKIIETEDNSTKDLACQFTFARLAWHIYRLREHLYFEPIMVWFLYLYEFNFNLPLAKWAAVGLKTVVGYHLTKGIKKLIRLGCSYTLG